MLKKFPHTQSTSIPPPTYQTTAIPHSIFKKGSNHSPGAYVAAAFFGIVTLVVLGLVVFKIFTTSEKKTSNSFKDFPPEH